ncbi:MAG: Na+/H+ antiporter NhaC family protein [Rubripirellula sp.]|nr:Na+/H+ antiporter NhaC family protein [Rubripirellula sp.]
MEPSFLSLIPALVAISLAFLTRQVLLALFLGIVSGGLVMWYQSNDISQANIVKNLFLPALGQESYATILLIYLWCLGGLMGLWEKSGGALHFARVVGGRVAVGPRSSLFFAWLLGCVFHQGGTVSTVLAGTTVKPVADKHRISHEELSYVVDSTASPVATILPFNAWPGYIAALVAGTVPEVIPDVVAGLKFFFSSLQYNFYGFLAVSFTFLFALHLLPWVGKRMSEARQRARSTGELDREGSAPMLSMQTSDLNPESQLATGYTPSLWDFFVPLAVLLSLAILPYMLYRINFINEAFMACVLSAMGIAAFRGMQLRDILNGFVNGCKTMTIGAIILGLAVTIGFLAKELRTADYLVTLLGDQLPVVGLPAILMLLCMGIAFSCGTSFGTYAVVFPVAMPLAWAVHQDPTYLSICFGAVLGGAVFGDQCSPISDTTILASMFTGCDLMDHVATQLPLALAAATLAAGASTLCVIVFV